MFSFKRDSGYNGWIGALVVAALGGMVTFAAYAWRVGPHAGRTVAAGILVAGAFLLVGGLTGFPLRNPADAPERLGEPGRC